MVFDPKKRPLIITHSVKSIVTCDFAENGMLPEFRGRHPSIIVSIKNKSSLPYLLVPATSKMPDKDMEYCHLLQDDIINNGKDTWIICSHIYAVSKARIHGFRNQAKVTPRDFAQIVAKLHLRLPSAPET